MILRLSFLLALLVALSLWPQTAAAANRQPCAAKGSKTLVASERARVFKWHAEHLHTYEVWGCNYKRNRRYRLGYNRTDYDPYPPHSEIKLITLSGRYVAWVNDYQERAGGTTTVSVFNLRTGVTKHTWVRGSYQYFDRNPDWDTEHRHYLSITDAALKPGGAVAWIAWTLGRDTGDQDYIVFKSDATGEGVMLDSGTGLDQSSLALSGSTIYWMNDGQPRSAPLY